MIKFIQKPVENLLFSRIIEVYLFVPNLCLRLSEVQPGESSSVKSGCRWIFQIITPHPLYSSDSVSRERELFQPDLFSFGKPFQILNPMALLGKEHVLGVMLWLLCHGQAQDPSPFTSIFCLAQLWKSRYVHMHIFGCAGMRADDSSRSLSRQVWKIRRKTYLLYKNSKLISYKITKDLINEEDHLMLPN